MKKIVNTLMKIPGQGLIEYALILVFIALVVIVVLRVFGPSLGSIYSQIGNSLTTAMFDCKVFVM
jgi:pilus assembly protein Flp/PilA